MQEDSQNQSSGYGPAQEQATNMDQSQGIEAETSQGDFL